MLKIKDYKILEFTHINTPSFLFCCWPTGKKKKKKKKVNDCKGLKVDWKDCGKSREVSKIFEQQNELWYEDCFLYFVVIGDARH